ncbi:MAG: RNB domain-containing ribonuclease [Myxococcota bacterium]
MSVDTVEALITEHELRVDFGADVLAEADAHEASPGLDDPTLEDLTGLPFATIDEVTSRDLDQALYVEADAATGDFVAWYAIADAAHYVPVGSATFREALLRGATYYFPGRNVPMLPRTLSEGIVSLNPAVHRRALVWRMAVATDGHCTTTTLHRARIRSRAKLDYDGVQAWFDGQRPDPTDDPEVLASLRALAQFGECRLAVAETRGVVQIRRREVTVGLGDAGLRFVAQGDERNDVERFNEQLSLLCNIEGARRLEEAEQRLPELVQPIFRVHRPPNEDLLDRLAAQLKTLCAHHDLPVAQWVWSPDEGPSLAKFLDRLPVEQRVSQVVHRQVVMMNRAATFETEPGPHHGVGASRYGRFSAPMREVVGVFLHQELAEAARAKRSPLPANFATPEALQQAVIDAATTSRQRQRTIDRQLNRAALDQIFTDATTPLPATVMGVSRGRVHVQLDEPPIDAKVYFRHLSDRHGPLTADALGMAAHRADGTPLVVAGDSVQVRVLGRDAETDRWALDLG